MQARVEGVKVVTLFGQALIDFRINVRDEHDDFIYEKKNPIAYARRFLVAPTSNTNTTSYLHVPT